MTTIDDITEAARTWCLSNSRRPAVAMRIVDGEYADGTRVSVGFTPDMFASQPPNPGFLYRLSRDRWAAQTCFTEEFLFDAGLAIVHKHTKRELDSPG